MSVERKKPAKFIFIFFLLFPLVFQIIGVFIILNTFKTIKQGIETTAEIVDVDSYYDNDSGTMYRAIVEYNCGNDELVRKTSSTSTSWSPNVGSIIEIYCNPSTGKYVENSFMGKYFGAIFIVFPIIFQLIGGIGLYIGYSKNKLKRKLLQSGNYVHANIVNIGFNRNYTVNGRNPLQIICEYIDQDTQELYEFKSENIWLYDISKFVKVGDTRKIFHDINNYQKDFSKYYMDISDIPVAQ